MRLSDYLLKGKAGLTNFYEGTQKDTKEHFLLLTLYLHCVPLDIILEFGKERSVETRKCKIQSFIIKTLKLKIIYIF